jgi:hypothetical protein
VTSNISIVKHKRDIKILDNYIAHNSGTKGLIYIDSFMEGRTIVSANKAYYNGGYIDSTFLYIRARGPSTGSVFTKVPSEGNVFCTGVHISDNEFANNYNCPLYGGAFIKMECIDYAQTSSAINDAMTHPPLSASVAA